MLRLRGAAVLVAGCILVGPVGHAADRAVHLRVPPPVLNNVASMPLIIAPTDAAESQINAAVRRLDATAGNVVDACKGLDGKPGDWERSMDAPMRGPGYIGYVITDNLFCGGAHPDVSTMSIVYDLRSGAPVDWTRLLPPSLTGTVALEQGADGTRMVTLASKRLFALYLEGYRAGSADSQAACRQAIRDVAADGAAAAMVWPDARTGGLAVQVGLPHVVQACEAAVLIPVATLRAEGAQPALVDAIQAALQK
jgi:hypothetical protein